MRDKRPSPLSIRFKWLWRSPRSLTCTFFSAALVVLLFVCVPKNLALDVIQDIAPSVTGEGALKEGSLLAQCVAQYLLIERNVFSLNLKEFISESTCSLKTLSNLARDSFTLGELDQRDAKKQWFEKGCYYAKILARRYPRQVEGHYWLALNLCGLSDFIGAGRALVQVPVIVEHLEAALSLDQGYDQAGPLRALGRIRYMAPSWPLSEGDPVAAVRHLRSAVKIAPDNSTNHLYLGEALLEQGNREEGCRELEKAISSTQHSVSPCGLEEDRVDAFHLMKRRCL